MKLLDMTGQVFGRLFVEKQKTEGRAGNWRQICLCLCSCGQYCSVAAAHLRTGDTKSCGCLHLELAAELGKRQAPKLNTRSVFAKRRATMKRPETRMKCRRIALRKAAITSRRQRGLWNLCSYRAKMEAALINGLSREARQRQSNGSKTWWSEASPEALQRWADRRRATLQKKREERMDCDWTVDEKRMIEQKARVDRCTQIIAIRRLRSCWLVGETRPPTWPLRRPMPKANPRHPDHGKVS